MNRRSFIERALRGCGVLLLLACASANSQDCGGLVKIMDKGNSEHAWFYVRNEAKSTVDVTVESSWVYQGERRSKTDRLELYPKQEHNVLNFPRNQQPRCRVLACRIVGK